MTDPKIKYDIEAAVSGDADVSQLVQRLQELGKTLDSDVKAQALAAATALRELSSKRTAIDRFIELKAAARDAANGLLATQTAADKLGAELAALQSPTKAQQGALQKLYNDVRLGTQEVSRNTTALAQAREALGAYGISTQNLSQSQKNINGALAAARAEANQLASSYTELGKKANQSGTVQVSSHREIAKGMTSISQQLGQLQTLTATAVGGGFLGGLAKDALATADNFNNLQARVKLATGEGALFTASFAEVAAIAKRTGSNLEQTANLFTKVTEAGKSAGLSTQAAVAQSLALTETINQAIQLSGGSADSAKAAITQLIQGLQSGVLRGDEFNSIMEQSPRLAKALADGLSVTTGELRKMSEAGALSADVVIKALHGQASAIKTEFGSLPATVGRSVENLQTQWSLYLGELDRSKGITQTVANAINVIATNLSGIATAAGQAALVWGGYAASQKLAALAATQTAAAVAGQAAATTSATVVTAGHGQAAAAAARATRTYHEALGLATPQINAQAAASTQAAVATRAHAASLADAAKGGFVVGTATGAATHAVGLGGDAAVAATSRWAGLGGAVLAVAGKLTLIGTVAYAAFKGISALGKELGEGAAKMMGYRDAEVILAEGLAEIEAATKAATAAQQAETAAKEAAIAKTFDLSRAALDLIGKFDGMVKGGDSAAEAIGKIGKDFDLASIPGIKTATAVLDKLAADAKISAFEFSAAWAKALDGKDLVEFNVKARAALMGTAREAERTAQVMDATLREAVRRTGLDFEVISGGMGKASRSAINDIEYIIGGLDKLKGQGVDTAQVLSASFGKAINTADSQKAIDAITERIESMRNVLGATVTNGLLDQAKQKAVELKDALEKLTPGIQSVREALKLLGVTSDEELKKTSKTFEDAYLKIVAGGKASARELQEAFQKFATTQIAASDGVASEWLKNEAALRGLEITADKTGKTIVRAMGEGAEGAHKFGAAVDSATSALERQLSTQEKRIALQERQNALVEREAELNRKIDNVDKQGFALDKDGNQLTVNTPTERSTYETAKQQGLSDAQALELKNQFWENGQQVRGAGQGNPGSNWGVELQKAIDQVVLTNAAKAAALGTSTPPAPNSTAKVYTVNVNVGGVNTPINTSSDADAQALISVLQRAKLTSGL